MTGNQDDETLCNMLVSKPVNLFPVTSQVLVIAITKRKKSSKTNHEKWEEALSLPQVAKFTCNSNLRTLAQGTVGLQILENTQIGGQKAEPLESNTTKLANLDKGHQPETSSQSIYLSSQIFGTSQHAKFGEKPAMICRRSKAEIFLCLNANNS